MRDDPGMNREGSRLRGDWSTDEQFIQMLPNNFTPEKHLISAILARAFLDLQQPEHQVRNAAIQWFRSISGSAWSFHWVLHILDLEESALNIRVLANKTYYEKVQEIARKRAYEETEKLQTEGGSRGTGVFSIPQRRWASVGASKCAVLRKVRRSV